MSLKTFHIFFIIISILLLSGLVYWAFETNEIIYAVFSLLGAVALIIYGRYFLKKMKRLKQA
jgi:hypothetical protein